MANAYDIALSVVGKSIDIETNGFKAIDKVTLSPNRGTLYQCVDLPNYVANKLGYESWNGVAGSALTGDGVSMWSTVNRNNADVIPFDASQLKVGDIVSTAPNHIYVYGGGTFPKITAIEQNMNGHSWVDKTNYNRTAIGESPTHIIRFKNQTESTGDADSSGSESLGSFDKTTKWVAYEVICDEIQVGERTFYKCNIVYGQPQNTQVAVWLNTGVTVSVGRECLKERPDLDKTVTVHDEEAEKLAKMQAELDDVKKQLANRESEDVPSVDVSAPTTEETYATSNRQYYNDGTFIEDGIRYDSNGNPVNGWYYLDGKRRFYSKGKDETALAKKASKAQKALNGGVSVGSKAEKEAEKRAKEAKRREKNRTTAGVDMLTGVARGDIGKVIGGAINFMGNMF